MAAAPRFFVDDEPALHARLAGYLDRLAADLDAQAWNGSVRALVLAGGYGRGEGGVFRESEGGEAKLYNDLEFFLFLGPGADEGEAARWCARHEQEGTRELGIDVEFKRDRASVLAGGQPTMFWHDLLQGHHVVWGDAGLLASADPVLRDPARLPAVEATRLLFNRGSGLWFSVGRLEASGADEDGFVERNHMKARLALADAVLALAGRHHGLCEERARRLRSGGFPVPPEWDRLLAWHGEAVAFKLRPRHRRPGPAALHSAQEELTRAWRSTFLWLEGSRLGRTFATESDYLSERGRLYPDEPWHRNVARHLRDRLKRGESLPVRAWPDLPRAALQRALLAALSGDEAEAARRLGTAGASGAGLIKTYARWWGRYN